MYAVARMLEHELLQPRLPPGAQTEEAAVEAGDQRRQRGGRDRIDARPFALAAGLAARLKTPRPAREASLTELQRVSVAAHREQTERCGGQEAVRR